LAYLVGVAVGHFTSRARFAMSIMLIVGIAWIYVVLMMSLAETSAVAGIMTFLFYGALPVAIILYLMGAPERKRRRIAAEKARAQATDQTERDAADGNTGS
jgi:TRAP-type C4-dicarboxylate transport system permease small subunit